MESLVCAFSRKSASVETKTTVREDLDNNSNASPWRSQPSIYNSSPFFVNHPCLSWVGTDSGLTRVLARPHSLRPSPCSKLGRDDGTK